MEEIKLQVIHDDSKSLDILVITETCFSNKNVDLFALPDYDPGGYSHILAIRVCAAGEDMVFQPFGLV